MAQEPEKYKDVIKLKIPYSKKPYSLILSHNFYDEHTEMSEKIWNTIKKIRTSETSKIIRKRYF